MEPESITFNNASADLSGTSADPDQSGAGGPLPSDPDLINILLVDDEPRNLTALETVLDSPGYRLVRAGSADEALMALVGGSFALLVLDIQMPGMNGFELATMIKQRKKTADIPIIFLTAYYSDDAHVIEGYSSGAVDFLHKPINPRILRSKVAVFADLHRKTREAEAANRSLRAEMADRQRAEDQLRVLNQELEQRVLERTTKLSLSEERFRALAEDMPHLVWEMDSHGRMTFHNARWKTYTGHGLDAGSSGWLSTVHPEDSAELEPVWSEALQQGCDCDAYFRHRCAADGSYRWFHFKAVPVRGSLGQIDHWVATSTDIHEQRIAEQALREVDRRKDEFLAMLGHELRNPLAAIRHAVNITRESPLEDLAARQWASEVIDRQSRQLTRMVDDLLNVERITRGRIDMQLGEVALGMVMARAMDAVDSLMKQKNHRLNFSNPFPDLVVQGDPDRLEQVFVNLLHNAGKYTPEGGTVEVSISHEGKEAVIRISDNGIGIPAELKPFIFDLFTQAPGSLDRSEGGLGIGLTVVRSLVEMQGGGVSLEEQGKGRGTTFRICLPVLVQEAGAGESAAAAAPPEEEREGLRVLLVDDHVDGAQTLARLLSRRGFEVRVAYDGPSGISAAKEFLPEVLLLDLGLPGLDGYQLARELREDPDCRNSIFIAISGYAQDGDREKSFQAGFDHHCPKPIDLAALVKAIRSRV